MCLDRPNIEEDASTVNFNNFSQNLRGDRFEPHAYFFSALDSVSKQSKDFFPTFLFPVNPAARLHNHYFLHTFVLQRVFLWRWEPVLVVLQCVLFGLSF